MPSRLNCHTIGNTIGNCSSTNLAHINTPVGIKNQFETI